MPKYEIQSWNSVIPKGSTFPLPMIYIKPDSSFIDYAKKNNWQVLVKITDSDSPYEGNEFYATIDSSGYFPNFRPYFYNDKGYFTVTLLSQWRGYPKEKNGNAIIRGLEDVMVEASIPTETPKPLPWLLPWDEMYQPDTRNRGENKEKNLSSSQVGWLLTGILIVFCVLLYTSSVSQKNHS